MKNRVILSILMVISISLISGCGSTETKADVLDEEASIESNVTVYQSGETLEQENTIEQLEINNPKELTVKERLFSKEEHDKYNIYIDELTDEIREEYAYEMQVAYDVTINDYQERLDNEINSNNLTGHIKYFAMTDIDQEDGRVDLLVRRFSQPVQGEGFDLISLYMNFDQLYCVYADDSVIYADGSILSHYKYEEGFELSSIYLSSGLKASGETYTKETHDEYPIADFDFEEYDKNKDGLIYVWHEDSKDYEYYDSEEEYFIRLESYVKDKERMKIVWFSADVAEELFSMSPDIYNQELYKNYFNVKVVAQDGGVNLRKGPGTEYEIIYEMVPTGSVMNGEKIIENSEGKKWVKVKYNRILGWVSASQVEY